MRKTALICLLSLQLQLNGAGFYKGLQVNLFPGFLIAHREYMANMEAHTMGFEIIYSSNYTGWKQTDKAFKNIRWGTGFTFLDLGNRELNGYVYAWHAHVEAMLRKRGKFQSALRFGSGIGYLDRPYDLYTNRKNKAIGSRFNGNMQVMYKAYIDLSPKTSLVLGTGITHYSNGNFKRPNLGINVAHLNFGLLRKIKLTETPGQRELPLLFPKNGFEVSAGFARKQIAVADTRFFNIYSASLLYYFRQTETRNWRLGSDVFFDKTYPYKLFDESSLQNRKLPEYTEIAIKAGHEFLFGRVAIVTDIGTYVYRPNDYKKRVYFSIGFSYFLNRGISVQTRLKSHMAVADYFHWSAGYRFRAGFKKDQP